MILREHLADGISAHYERKRDSFQSLVNENYQNTLKTIHIGIDEIAQVLLYK